MTEYLDYLAYVQLYLRHTVKDWEILMRIIELLLGRPEN